MLNSAIIMYIFLYVLDGTGKYIMHVTDQFALEPEGCFDDTSFNCELDLDTMAWTRVTADFIYQLVRTLF